jgi:sterol desaturase/sphingolipid hydroxylase (fatty acid hydroxylase superfamily)
LKAHISSSAHFRQNKMLISKTVIVALWFAAFFIAERLARAASPPKSPARLVHNGGLWLIVLALSPLIVAPMTAWGANHVLWMRPQWMTVGAAGAAILVLDLVLLDLWTYWLHRAYHRMPAMWRLHEVHHRDEFLDTTSAVRFHAGEVVLSATLRLIPIAILALPLATVVIFETLVLCAAVFHHSNIRLPERLESFLSGFVVTPSIHWVHHHAVGRDTNSNYATILSLWDPLFGSRSASRRFQDMKIGVEGFEDKPLLGLILMPLHKG